MRKITGTDQGKLYAMKVIKKAAFLQKTETAEQIQTERQVLEAIRPIPRSVSLHYAFQSDAKLHLVMGKLSSAFQKKQNPVEFVCILCADYGSDAELFTRRNKRQYFSEHDAKVYIAELTLALDQLHKVTFTDHMQH